MYDMYKDMDNDQLVTYIIQLEQIKGLEVNLEPLLKNMSREMLISRIIFLERLEDKDE